MHEPLLALAALPAQVRICGIPLRPYSLGHELLLIREKNPFVFGGEVLPGDLLEAMWICASDWEGARASQNTWLYIPKLWLFKRAINRAIKRKRFDQEVDAFSQYIKDGNLQLPLSDIVRPGQPSPRSPGAPFILRLHDFLCSHYRLSLSEAWDFPCGEAKMRWETHWEQEGGLEVYNEENAQIDQLIQEAEAEESTQKGEKS